MNRTKAELKDNHAFTRFEMISMILCYMVIMIHSSYASFYHASGHISFFLGRVYTDYLSGFAVPSFFALSAIKFYRNYDYTKTISKYQTRLKSLVIPFFIWNALSVIWNAMLSYIPFLSQYVTGREKFVFSAANIIGGVLWFKYIHPFWYLALLIIFVLLCPFFYFLIKNRRLGFIVLALLYIIDALPIEFPKTSWPMFQIRTIVYCSFFYLLGGMIGRYQFDAFCQKPRKMLSVLGIFGYAAAVLMRWMTNDSEVAFIPAILLGFLSLWLIVGAFDVQDRKVISLSFFIYPAHTFVLPCIGKLLFIALPKYEWISILNTCLSTFLTFVICILLGLLLKKTLPTKLWSVLNGAR